VLKDTKIVLLDGLLRIGGIDNICQFDINWLFEYGTQDSINHNVPKKNYLPTKFSFAGE
jgi:hypothetical protein